LLDIFVLTAFIAHVSFKIHIVTITSNFLLYRHFALIIWVTPSIFFSNISLRSDSGY